MRTLLLSTFILSGAPLIAAAAERLPLATAQQLVAVAKQFAESHQAPGGAIAIVDDGAHLVALSRLDGSFPAATDVAIGKATTAAMFRKPTSVFEDIVNKGRVTMLTLPAVTKFTPLQGGIPLTLNGEVIGAIGVSGAASAQQDEEIARAAADSLVNPNK